MAFSTLPPQLVTRETVSFGVLEFESRRFSRFFFFSFSKFLSLASFFRVRLSVRFRVSARSQSYAARWYDLGTTMSAVSCTVSDYSPGWDTAQIKQ